jgi:hypothetical protein
MDLVDEWLRMAVVVVVVQMDLKREEIVREMVEKKICLFVVGQEISELYQWLLEELEEEMKMGHCQI